MSLGSHPTARKSPSDRVFGLDLLRAAAIMMVVCAHGFVVLYPHLVGVLGIFGHGGFYGVELFFVLRGFLIGQILIRTRPRTWPRCQRCGFLRAAVVPHIAALFSFPQNQCLA